MLLIQTAFDQERAAVQAAGSQADDRADGIRLIAGRECQVLMTGIGPQAARRSLTSHLDRGEPPELVLSIGLAGGLLADLSFGQTCLIDQVALGNQTGSDSTGSLTANLDRLSSNLRERMRVHSLVTLMHPALDARAKRQLTASSSAGLCDMETHAIAALCQQRNLAWLGARVVSDAVDESIPAWIISLPRLIEQKRWLSVLSRVATHPQDFPALLRLGRRMQRLKPILTQLTIDLVSHVRT